MATLGSKIKLSLSYLIANTMKILKNLFGKSDTKIDANEIAINGNLLGNAVIVESGSNANGSYIKFGDGTMICTGQKTVTGKIDVEWGSLYYLTIGNFIYPERFRYLPYITVVSKTNRSFFSDVSSSHFVDKSATVAIYRPMKDVLEYEYVVGYIAIGRWK